MAYPNLVFLDFLESLGCVDYLGRLCFVFCEMLNYSNFKLWVWVYLIYLLCVYPNLINLDFLECLENLGLFDWFSFKTCPLEII